MSGDDCLGKCLVGTGMFFCFEALEAAASAASGALGYGILTSANGWHVAEFTCASMTQAQTVGGLILGCPASACLSCLCVDALINNRSFNPSDGNAGLASAAFGGALSGMLGAKILGFLNGNTQVGYAAAAGATGSAVLTLSIVGLVLVVGGPVYCCAVGLSGDPVLVEIPPENVQNGEIVSFENATLRSPSELGINASSVEGFAQQVADRRKNQESNQIGHGAPSNQEDMNRADNLTKPLLRE